ncbi:carbohydrate ABC transporter permease [Kribbella sp. DT2]|uniref:carbohydrate ABC transporter permease n=1 Tax=Kribbella sp. DT2 TaxID=3393427 RepID=UPI003CF5DA4E
MILDQTLAGKVAKFAGLGICLVLTVFPLYWILVTSFKDPGSIFAYPLKYWPTNFSLDNYTGLFKQSNFGVFIGNSLIVSLVAAALATLVSLLAAYVLARFEFVSKGAVMGAFLVTQMIPGFIALGSLYILMTRMYLVDSRVGLILVYVAVSIPLCTVMLRGFFENVPASLEEAAMVDGCSRLSALFRVLVPVMTPGIAASYIFNFVNCWNELFLSVTLLNSDSNKTVPAALNGFISSYNIDWGSMSAAAVLSIIPTMILFAVASRYIVQGLTAGAVKE